MSKPLLIKMTFEIEERLALEGFSRVCGVDEAGRGPLCGPVYAGAVILPPGLVPPEGLNDSKKLSERQREALFDRITEFALAFGIGSASVEEIEELNILNAALLAMRRAVEQVKAAIQPDYLLVDGNIFRGFDIPGRFVVGGDAVSPSIAAASVLAKVSRDRVMREYDEIYPEYGFAKHKGYGTKAHYAAIEKQGLCPIHRPSFFKKYNERRGKGGL